MNPINKIHSILESMNMYFLNTKNIDSILTIKKTFSERLDTMFDNNYYDVHKNNESYFRKLEKQKNTERHTQKDLEQQQEIQQQEEQQQETQQQETQQQQTQQ
jgi:hypothetical protein